MKSKLATIDYYVQLVLLVIIAIGLLVTVFEIVGSLVATLCWILLSFWQGILSFIYAINYQDANRIRHLLYMVFLVLGLIGLLLLSRLLNFPSNIMALVVITAFIVSVWLAIWAFRLSDQARKVNDVSSGYDYEDLLDEGEIKN